MTIQARSGLLSASAQRVSQAQPSVRPACSCSLRESCTCDTLLRYPQDRRAGPHRPTLFPGICSGTAPIVLAT